MPVRVVSQLAAAREELRPHVLFGEGSGMRQLQGLRVWEERFLLRWLGRIGKVDSGQYSAALPFRASDWKLDHPDWTGRLRVTSKGKTAYIKLEDKVSGELFAQAPIDQYPGIAVETVADSSRYFVIRIQDGTGRSAFIGIGFTDRGDAFDFNVSLQDHFKWVKQETEISKESQEADTRPKLDLGFKEGQTIKLNIGNMTSKKGGAAKPRVSGSGGLSLLPPPPGGKIAVPPIPPPSSTAIANHVTPPPVQKSCNASSADILLDLDAPAAASKAPVSATTDLWGDFSTASSAVPNQAPQQSNWVQF
uniref:Adaptin ear-binding coat-associated protein 1 n=1 Tax=Taeniopygia guttata TaxID=59729 RepID=A0A674H054_TAEGU